MKLCQNCRLPNADHAAACAECHNRFDDPIALDSPKAKAILEAALAPDPEPNLSVIDAENPPDVILKKCPQCECPDIQKVSAICAHGSWQKSSVGTVTTLGYIDHLGPTVSGGMTSSHGHGATELAISLAPPQVPIPPKSKLKNAGCGWGCLTFFVISLAGSMISTAAGESRASDRPIAAGGMFAGIVAAVGIMMVVDKYAKSETAQIAIDNEPEEDRYRRNLDRWEHFYYCPKCHSVSDPVRHKTVSVSHLSSLYQ